MAVHDKRLNEERDVLIASDPEQRALNAAEQAAQKSPTTTPA
jgi:hypothetical protein